RGKLERVAIDVAPAEGELGQEISLDDEGEIAGRRGIIFFEDGKMIIGSAGFAQENGVEPVGIDLEQHRTEHIGGKAHGRMIQRTAPEPSRTTSHGINCAAMTQAVTPWFAVR